MDADDTGMPLKDLEPLALLESLVRTMPDAVTAADMKGRIIIASQRTAALHGAASVEEIIGKSVLDLLAPEEHARAAANTQLALESGAVGPVEYEMVRMDGSRFRGELSASVVPDQDGAPQAFVAAVRDVTERKRAERALRESEERYRTLVELMPDPVVVLQNSKYRFVSQSFTALFGYTQEDVDAGLSFYDLVPESDVDGVRQRYERRVAGLAVPRTYRLDLIAKDGCVIPCETSATLIRHEGEPADLVIIRDVRERVRALEREREIEAEFQLAQKMESLGLLAGGVAHDFGNLLVGVLAHAGLARRALPRNSKVRPNIDMIETAAQRAAELCDQLLVYSGREQPELSEVGLDTVATEMFELLHIPLARKARLELEVAPDLPAIAGDPTQLRQVLMNLVQNAADAIARPDGLVVVQIATQDCDAAFVDRHGLQSEIEPGLHVVVEVRDNGCGMDEQTAAQIFEPFYTTKRRGRGLGLAVVRGIVSAHGGAICIESAPGEGTVFRLLFPVLQASRVVGDGTEEPRSEPRLSGTVLVVDDEAMVRAVIRELLADTGLNVLVAANGEEALALFESRAEEISAVLVDVNMPGMSGEELLGRLRAVDPDVRVVLSSGFRSNAIARLVASEPQVGFVAKPFDLEQLIGTLREALGSPVAARR